MSAKGFREKKASGHGLRPCSKCFLEAPGNSDLGRWAAGSMARIDRYTIVCNELRHLEDVEPDDALEPELVLPDEPELREDEEVPELDRESFPITPN